MSSTKYNLLVVAHPDDEAIFFGGLLQARRMPNGVKRAPWMVICVTDANADRQGAKRHRQFAQCMRKLKIAKWHWWGFPDVFARRLDVDALTALLRTLPDGVQAVFTHGIIGEYMHPHHQDVSFSVHTAFARSRVPVFSTAYNAYPDFVVPLTRAQFKLKTDLLTKVYGSETTRFLNILPATSTEGFVRVSANEVSAVYAFLQNSGRPNRAGSKSASPKRLARKDLNVYAWLGDYLETRPMKKRLF